jgi:hypothetical protein
MPVTTPAAAFDRQLFHTPLCANVIPLLEDIQDFKMFPNQVHSTAEMFSIISRSTAHAEKRSKRTIPNVASCDVEFRLLGII